VRGGPPLSAGPTEPRRAHAAPWRRAATLAAVVASAALATAAFPPLGLSSLAWIALVPLLWAVTSVRPRSAALHGLLYGALLALGVASWLPATLTRFFELSPAAAWLAFAALAAGLLGLPFAGFAAALSALARRAPVSPLVVAALFGAFEWARATLGIANPWALLAYALPPGSVWVQGADLGGPYLVGMMLVAVNALVAGLVAPALRPGRPWRAAAIGVALLAAAFGYGRARLAEDADGHDAFRVALVQSEEDPRAFRDRVPDLVGLDRKLALTARAVDAEPALVVWPELALDFSLADESAASARLLASAAASHAEWLVGAPDEKVFATRTDRTNSVFFVHGGRVAGRYDKARLMPFAEASLLPAWMAPWLRTARSRFVAADESRVRPIHAATAQLGVVLCSEAMHPAYVRALVARGADVLVNPAYDEWFADPGAVEQQARMAALRAVENRRMLLRAAAGGRTAVIDAKGRTVAALPPGASDVLVGDATRTRVTTPYQRVGDLAAFAAVAVSGLALLRARFQRNGAAAALPARTKRLQDGS
jgi:apolipoprotein N-acyltransferase